jgi:hypothetical protein
MFDLVLGHQHVVEGGAQDEAEITRYQPLFRDFWVLDLCNGYGNVIPWVYPCLGLIF